MMVSVVIPMYNSEKTIISCIESVLNQTYQDFEILVVDDGSVDSSVRLLDEFILKENLSKTIKVISQKNQGPSVARNKAVDRAKGKFIAFLDSDDYWHENKLEVQISCMIENPNLSLCSVAYGNKRFPDSVEKMHISFNKLCFKNYFATPGVMLKKEIARLYPFDVHKKYSEDYLCWLLVCHSNECLYINTVMSANIENKAIYGEGGLSSKLWQMEKGELSNFRILYKKKMITILKFIQISVYSLMKYIYRLCNVTARKYGRI